MKDLKNIEKQNSISFHDYFIKVKGEYIEIDLINNKVMIYGNNIISKLLLSKSINHHFTFKELMKIEHKIGDYLFFVFENGYDNQNWLWCSQVILRL